MTSEQPVYQTIANAIREQIESGALKPGDPLKSEREYQEQFDASRGPVRQALKVLREEGLIDSGGGRRTTVRERPTINRDARTRFAGENQSAFFTDAATDGFTADVNVTHIGLGEPAPAEIADLLKLAEGAPVLVRRRVYFRDGHPVQAATSYVPWLLAKGTQMVEEDTGPGGLYQRINEAGHPVEGGREFVTTRLPTRGEVDELRIPSGTPVMLVTRVACDPDGVPVEVCDSVMPGDRWSLSYPWSAAG